MTQASTRYQRGWALPVVMFGTALIIGWARLITLETTATSLFLPIISRGEEIRAHSKERLALNNPLSRECHEISLSHDSIETSYIRCSEGAVPFRTQPPYSLPQRVINYDALFSRAGGCSTTPTRTSRLASGVPKALFTCTLPRTIVGGLTLLDNIKADTVSLITQNSDAALMATPGSVTITGTLSISQDLLIVSGGDIDIAVIHNTAEAHHRVTVISSLGAITVGRVVGSVSLLVAGRATIQAPETSPSTTFPLPPMRNASLRGFASRSSISPF